MGVEEVCVSKTGGKSRGLVNWYWTYFFGLWHIMDLRVIFNLIVSYIA